MEIEKRKKSNQRRLFTGNVFRWVLLTAITGVFVFVLSPDLVSVNQKYLLGDVADRNIKAPRDFFIEDEKATEANRNKAVGAVLTIYDHDVDLSSRINQRLNEAFALPRAAIEKGKLKQSQAVSQGVEAPADKTVQENKSLQDLLWGKKPEFEKKLGLPVSKGAYGYLVKEEFSENIPGYVSAILSEILGNGVVTNKELLLKEGDKGIILRAVESKTETAFDTLKQVYGLDQAKAMVRIIGQPLLKDQNHALVNVVVDFAQQLVQPNITLNKSETEERKKAAAAEIKPVLNKIKAGEMILREGERVTEVQLLKLKALQVEKKREQILASSGSAAVILLCLLLVAYVLHVNPQAQMKSDHNKNLLFMCSLLIVFLFLARISASLTDSPLLSLPYAVSASSLLYGIPIASAAMTVCLFLGLQMALPFAIITAACTAMVFQNSFEVFMYFFISSSMAAYWIQDCKERKVFIKAGLKLGLLNVLLAAAINLYGQNPPGAQLLWDCAFGFMGGIGAGIITAGIAPIIEISFGYTTDTTLLELANLDRPILHKLMIEAPGTYHHSVIVGSLAEAAASEINANPLLAKVCGYYHDIGKVKKPLYFIENQSDGRNKHDKLAPSMSSLILIAHIKDGVETARANGLGQNIIDTIQQHHGTSLITYFFDKAKKLKGEHAVNVDNFRYPGPKPQNKEAGLVMLADVVEAASRTLENPTPSRIQGLVRNLINKMFSDGQLDNCELTLKDLDNIAKSFNKILNGIHHHRIEYPDSGLAGKRKVKNGSPDRRQAKQNQNSAKADEEKGPNHLKRLGMS